MSLSSRTDTSIHNSAKSDNQCFIMIMAFSIIFNANHCNYDPSLHQGAPLQEWLQQESSHILWSSQAPLYFKIYKRIFQQEPRKQNSWQIYVCVCLLSSNLLIQQRTTRCMKSDLLTQVVVVDCKWTITVQPLLSCTSLILNHLSDILQYPKNPHDLKLGLKFRSTVSLKNTHNAQFSCKK